MGDINKMVSIPAITNLLSSFANLNKNPAVIDLYLLLHLCPKCALCLLIISGSDKFIHDRDMAWLLKSDGKWVKV